MDQATWKAVVDELSLSPQQTRIVELILHGFGDKRIAAELEISFSTLRSHLERIYHRLEVPGSKGLILLVLRTALARKGCPQCRQN